MKSKRNGSNGGEARRRTISVTWLVLAVVVAAALAVGACALFLPDCAPALLDSPEEITSAEVSGQRYDGRQSVNVVPELTDKRDLIINASGTVTADYSAAGLDSGKAALAVNGRQIVALSTATPLYRDLAVGDSGPDVRALKAELARLGYGAPADADSYTRATANAVKALGKAVGAGFGDSGSLPLADVLWLPQEHVSVSVWQGVVGLGMSAGSPVGQIPGGITKLTVKNGSPSDRDRTLTIFGQSATLPAGTIEIADARFCRQVADTADFQQMTSTPEIDMSQGLDAVLELKEPVVAVRVPAAAVFGVVEDGNARKGCVMSGGRSVPVTIVGADLGVSLVQTEDGSALESVTLGSALDGASSCR